MPIKPGRQFSLSAVSHSRCSDCRTKFRDQFAIRMSKNEKVRNISYFVWERDRIALIRLKSKLLRYKKPPHLFLRGTKGRLFEVLSASIFSHK